MRTPGMVQNQCFKALQRNVKGVGGDVRALQNHHPATAVLNVRFYLADVTPYSPGTYAEEGDHLLRIPRYLFYSVADEPSGDGSTRGRRDRAGVPIPPKQRPYIRKPSSEILCSPEHSKMCERLRQLLRQQYPGATIKFEENFIDVRVQTETEIILHEIKCDLSPRRVIREALGQLLEYAYHPGRTHHLPVRLCIVGRSPLSAEDERYLDCLRDKFSLPLSYQQVPL